MNPELKDLFLLNPEVTFLNFGSFGATPIPIFEKYQALQKELEYEPVQFITQKGLRLLEEARFKLGDYVGCHGDDLVFTTSPSYAINTVAKALKFNPGDEILATNLEYGALDTTWKFYCEKSGAKYIQQPINLPIESKESILNDFWKGYTKNTKAIFISQITSFTGLILPVKEICEEAKKRGLLTIVDGAHVPGHIPLNLSELEIDIYTGACHKWMMAPKGSSFLYAKKNIQPLLEPLSISWGYELVKRSHSEFINWHEMNGTRDYTAFLTVPSCIDFMEKYDWSTVAKNCSNLTIQNASRFYELVEQNPIAPLKSEFYGQLCSIPISCENPVEVQKRIFNEFKIEVPLMSENNRSYLRYSINAFNSQEDLDKLYSTVKQLQEENLI